MSWMQLLAVGKSIDAVKDRPTPYRMTQQNLLPRFGRRGGQTVDSPEVEARGIRVEFRPTSGKGLEGFEVAARRSPSRWGWGWVKRLFGFGSRVSREGAPVQSELGLEGVRVVRNDLMGDDVEWVEATGGMAPKEGDRRAGWGWLKWFGWRRGVKRS